MISASQMESTSTKSPSPRLGLLLLAAAVVVSGAILVVFGSHLTFKLDDWDLLINRRGWGPSVFLDPHNDHIIIAPAAIYKFLQATFGMSSYAPFQLAAVAVFLSSAVLMFVYIRRRVGVWPALVGAVAILFLGASWEDLLSAFQVGYFGSMAAGLGAMLALDRGDKLGDRVACILIVLATSFSEIGIPFAVAALVAVVLGRRPWRGRLYVALIPIALYGIWWLGWGHTAESALSLHNAAITPQYVLDEVSVALEGLVGLAPGLPGAADPLDFGRALLIVAAALALFRLHRLGKVPPGVWVALALGLSFWLLAGLNQDVFRPPTSGRYLYPSAVFVLLIAAELLSGLRIGTPALALAGVILAAAAAGNLQSLHRGYEYLRSASDQGRADLAALETARPAVKPGFQLDSSISGLWLVPVEARAYYSAVDAYGSPADTQAELASAPAPLLVEPDRILAAALGLQLSPAPSSAASTAHSRGSCRTAAGQSRVAHVGPGTITVKNAGGTPTEVLLGRFSDALPVDLGRVAPHRAATLTVPADRSRRAWRLGTHSGAVTVCALAGASA